MIKVKIILDFDNHNPTIQDIINRINELGEDLDYSICCKGNVLSTILKETERKQHERI